jgi:hypothetical protein
MSNLTSVTVTNGVPTAGTGTVSTIDALMADGGQTTIGAQADAAQTDHTATASLIAFTKGIIATLKTLVVLGAGTHIIGKVTTDQTTHGTTDLVAADVTKVAGAAIAQGHGTAATAVRVELPTDGTGIVGAADGGIVTIGAKADAKNSATDTTAISAMSVWKQVSSSIQAAAASLSGTISVSDAAAETSLVALAAIKTDTDTVAGAVSSSKMAVKTADGDQVTLGVTTGAAVITDAAGTVQQYLRGLVKLIAAKIGVTVADGDAATLGAKADAAVTDSTASASAIAALKGLLTAIGTKAAGTAALKSFLMGGVFNTAYPTLTNGQQAALSLDAAGGLALVGSRPLVVKGTINNGQTAYNTIGTCIGSLITVATGLPAGTVWTAVTARIKLLPANLTSGGSLTLHWFDANPGASTFTDNSAVSLAAADLGKGIFASGVALAVAGALELASFTGPRITVDGSGNIYLAVSNNNATVFASANVLAYEVDGTY